MLRSKRIESIILKPDSICTSKQCIQSQQQLFSSKCAASTKIHRQHIHKTQRINPNEEFFQKARCYWAKKPIAHQQVETQAKSELQKIKYLFLDKIGDVIRRKFDQQWKKVEETLGKVKQNAGVAICELFESGNQNKKNKIAEKLAIALRHTKSSQGELAFEEVVKGVVQLEIEDFDQILLSALKEEVNRLQSSILKLPIQSVGKQKMADENDNILRSLDKHAGQNEENENKIEKSQQIEDQSSEKKKESEKKEDKMCQTQFISIKTMENIEEQQRFNDTVLEQNLHIDSIEEKINQELQEEIEEQDQGQESEQIEKKVAQEPYQQKVKKFFNLKKSVFKTSSRYQNSFTNVCTKFFTKIRKFTSNYRRLAKKNGEMTLTNKLALIRNSKSLLSASASQTLQSLLSISYCIESNVPTYQEIKELSSNFIKLIQSKGLQTEIPQKEDLQIKKDFIIPIPIKVTISKEDQKKSQIISIAKVSTEIKPIVNSEPASLPVPATIQDQDYIDFENYDFTNFKVPKLKKIPKMQEEIEEENPISKQK